MSRQKPGKSSKPRRARRDAKPQNTFPIVGVGASAGGLEAFKQLLQELPADTGMAFVLVQHLDPDHPSALTQILTKSTSMAVREITRPVPIEPNKVYVIAPNTTLTIGQGILKLNPRSPGSAGHRTIDFFFESLAQDQRERAIGIILSGTATDGTLGLEAIKAEGGITFAQDDTAKYDSMPRSAVAAGCVDVVLSPEKIAHELARLARHPYITKGTSKPESMAVESAEEESADLLRQSQGTASSWRTILLLLRNHSGADFSFYKSSTIYRRISRRMVLNKIATFEDYAQFLRKNPEELEALFSDVLINVTSFFRNPEAFDTLKRSVFPSLAKGRRDDPLRVWVLGCSTGQEAYSIAMSYLEYSERLAGAPEIQIFATDLHDRMLEKARAGFYAKSIVGDVSAERLRKFFIEEDGGYRIIKPLRDKVVFARQNALSDPPFSRMDLISCRNLLIYIEPDLQKKVLPTFHYALKPHGFLFLGASESIGSFTDLFEPVDKKYRIFSKKQTTTPPLYLHLTPRHPAEKKGIPIPKRPEPAGGRHPALSTQQESDRLTMFRYAPPGVLVNAELQILQFRGDTSPYLKPPTGRASFDVLKMAQEGLMLPLRAAINKARKERREVRKENIKIGESKTVNIEVVPLNNLKERCYLIFFESGSAAVGFRMTAKAQENISILKKADVRRRFAEVGQELAETRDYLQSVHEQYEASNEELQASNEEVTSANEELQSVNEELETAKEELEATNEELTTVNEEMSHRNVELGRLNSDLINFQRSADVAVLLLGKDLTIRRFTEQAARQFNLLGSDIGRPISGIRHNLDIPSLEEFVNQAIDEVKEGEREVRDKKGRWFSLRVKPYLSLEKKVEGAVIVVMDIDMLKRNAQQIVEAREYAEAIVRTASDSLVVLDSGLRVHSANESFYRTFKTSPKETEGRLIYELGNSQWDISKLRELLEEVIPRNSFFTGFEVTHTFEHIGIRVMVLNARLLNDSTGRPARVLLGIQDITERVQAEEAQKALAAIVADSADAILSTDTAGIITSWNRAARRLFGYSAQEAIGQPVGILLPPEHAKKESVVIESIRRGEEVDAYETVQWRKDGSLVEISLSISPVRDLSGKVTGASQIARDISQRKQAEKQLGQQARQRQQLFQLADTLNRAAGLETVIFESALDAVLVCLGAQRAAILLLDGEGAMRFKAWRGLSKHYRQKAEGHSPWPKDALDPRPIGVKNITDAPVSPDLRQAIRQEGIAALAFIPLVYQRRLLGKFMVYYDASHDFTEQEVQLGETIANQLAFGLERKRAEEALRVAKDRLGDQAKELERAVTERTSELSETNKHLEAFVYSIAHDLRAPLRSMEGFSTMLAEEAGPALSDKGKDFAERISKSARFMDSLLMDLLTFSRISQERVELGPVSLETVGRSVLARIERDIQEKNARVEMIELGQTVLAHEPTLAQVLINLISNALKFVAPDTTPAIRLRAEERGEVIRVWVEDNGIGIAPEHQEQIFRLFTRLEGDRYPGTGIGLAIVQKGIEHMKGRVGLESSVGQGSRFWFELRKA